MAVKIKDEEMDSILKEKGVDAKDLDTRLNTMYILAGCIEALMKDVNKIMPPTKFKMKNREAFKRLAFQGQELRMKISSQIRKESGDELADDYKDTVESIKEFIVMSLKRVNSTEDMIKIHSTVKNYFKEK